jgi:hypothetical protein
MTLWLSRNVDGAQDAELCVETEGGHKHCELDCFFFKPSITT